MPLSEREQRLLDQMERALYQEDPKFATALRKPSARPRNGRRLFLGVLLLVVGMAALLGGVATAAVVLGVAGFVVMLGGVMLGIAAMRPTVAQAESVSRDRTDAATPAATGGSFMGKVEERWRRRRDHDEH